MHKSNRMNQSDQIIIGILLDDTYHKYCRLRYSIRKRERTMMCDWEKEFDSIRFFDWLIDWFIHSYGIGLKFRRSLFWSRLGWFGFVHEIENLVIGDQLKFKILMRFSSGRELRALFGSYSTVLYCTVCTLDYIIGPWEDSSIYNAQYRINNLVLFIFGAVFVEDGKPTNIRDKLLIPQEIPTTMLLPTSYI